MSQVVEFIKAVTALAWPLIFAILLWKLFPALRSIVTSRGFSVKIAGMEVSVQAATEQIRTQIDDLQKQVINLRSTRVDQPVVTTLEAPPPTSNEKNKSPRRILWVDDNPTNNAFEIAQLKARDVDVVQATSTEDALSTLNSSSGFSAVISDMGRREGGAYRSQAGLMFLKAMRRAGYTMPFLIYSSQKYASRNDEEVKAAGGDGATASPIELLEWVGRSLARETRPNSN
jgi:CheY-like chemotaxis protein